MTDCSADIVETIQSAREHGTPLYICAGNTKRGMLGRHCEAQPLDVSNHRGIVDFEPSELVITARGGTLLTELEQVLAPENLILPFEPPVFGGAATLGGTLACNLAGPARPWYGSFRDAVLGVQLISGRAEILNFGGKVMKNVAGYDVSRLQAGALGTLGVISEISLKVLPRPQATATLAFELPVGPAIEAMNRRAAQAKPLTGACWADGVMFLRLAGTATAVKRTVQLWGGERLSDDTQFWRDLREMEHPFFGGDQPLWRASHKPTAPAYEQFGEQLIDWSGAQRWLRGEHEMRQLEDTASAAGGHISLVRGGDRNGEVKQTQNSVERRLQLRLKQSFDPDAILNPGRMYSWM